VKRIVVALLAASACKDDARARPPPPPPSPKPPTNTAGVADLPGTLWFVGGAPPRLVRLARGERRDVVDPDGAVLYPSPYHLPDGRVVAIASRGDGSPDAEQLAVIAADGSAVTRLGPRSPSIREPATDLAGRWIVIAAILDGHSDLYQIDPTATGDFGLLRLTSNREGNFHPARIDTTSIAFVSSRDGDAEVYALDLGGEQRRTRRLTAFHRDDWNPVPSPDGQTIAFLSDREGPSRIFVMAPDGTRQRRLTDRTDLDVGEVDPVWSPDGRSIAYVVESAGKRAVWLLDVERGGAGARVTPDGARDGPPAFSPDGKWIAVARTIGRETDLHVMPVAGGETAIVRGPGDESVVRWH
jgi:TolB protein